MSADATHATVPGVLTEEEILALAARAKSDAGAVDEMMAALELQLAAMKKAEHRIDGLRRQIDQLQQRLALLLDRMYGRRTEKIDPDQLLLFQEGAPAKIEPEAPAEPPSTGENARRPSKGHGRDRFPAHLQRQEIRVDPDASELHCETCGKDYCRIRDEITERGHFIPGYWEIHRYVRGVWVCKSGCGGVRTADLPPTVVDKSRFEPSVAVQAAGAKYADHAPLERPSGMHARLGVEVAPTTLGDAVAKLAELHGPTVKQMEAEVLSEAHLHADETSVVAIIETPKTAEDAPETAKRRKKKTRIQARMWVYLTLLGKMFYRFTEDRSRDGPGGPAEVLDSFRGSLICDEYSGFDKICARPGMKRAACWAHVRRKFKDALPQDSRRAARIIVLIGRLFWIESAVRKRRERDPTFGDAQHLSVRQRRSRRQVEKIVADARSIEHSVLPKDALGRAVGYLLGNLEHIVTFLRDPLVPLDNNAAERALRCVAVGRKNYLHFGSLAGGDTAAVFYSLIGTCKAHGINPSAYLLDTTQVLLANRETPRASLTPWAWAAAEAQRIAAKTTK